MKKIFLILFLILTFWPFLTLAQLDDNAKVNIHTQAQAAGSIAGFQIYTDADGLSSIIEILIRGVLSLLGIIFIILMIIAGYNWMTAGGDEQKVSKSKDTIRHAIIGLVVVLSAYLITYFVFTLIPFGDGSGGGGGGGTVTPFD